MIRKSNLLSVVLLVICSISLYGCRSASWQGQEVPSLQKPVDLRLDSVQVKRGSIRNESYLSGYLSGISETDLFFRQKDTRLKDIYVTAGQYVEKGTILAELDMTPVEEAIEAQKKILDKMILAYEELQHIKELEIQLAELELSAAQRKLSSVSQLLTIPISDGEVIHGIPTVEIDKVKEDVQLITMGIARMHREYAQMKEIWELDIQWNRSKLLDLQSRTVDTAIVAPFSGNIVYIADIIKGQMVTPYRTVLKMMDISELCFIYSGDQGLLLDQAKDIYIRLGDKEYQGTILEEEEEQTLQALLNPIKRIRIRIAHLPADAQAGDLSIARAVREESTDTLLIPSNALYRSGTVSYVYRLENGSRKQEIVKIGMSTNAEVEILDGVQAGDILIIQ